MEIAKYIWLPIVLPFIVGAFNYKYFSKALKYLYFFVGYGCLNEITSFTLIKLGSSNTLFLHHFITIAVCVFLGLFYAQILKGFISNKILFAFIAIYLLYDVINICFIQSLSEYPSLPFAILNIVFVVLSILFFYKTMIEEKIVNLWEEPLIWINMAVLIYYSANLFFSLLFNLILEYSKELSKITVNSFGVTNALFYVLITVGFLKAGKQKKESPL